MRWGCKSLVIRPQEVVNHRARDGYVQPNGKNTASKLSMLLKLIGQGIENRKQNERKAHSGQDHMGDQDHEVHRAHASSFQSLPFTELSVTV